MSAGEFLDDHHALPLFKPFMSAERYRAVQEKILGVQATGIIQKLGIRGMSLFKSSYCYCWECMNQEFNNLGHAFQHRSHQLPGVNLCPIHDIALGTLDKEDMSFRCLDGLVIPVADIPSASPLKVYSNPEHDGISRKYGVWVQFILDKRLPTYPVEQRLAVVEARLQALEKEPDSPRSLPARLEAVLRKACGAGFLDDLGWKLDEGPTSHWPAMLLHGQVFSEQPVANILVLASLFERPQEFVEMAAQTGYLAPEPGMKTSAKRLRITVGLSRELLRDFLSMASLKEIAEKHGMHLETAQARLWAFPGLTEQRKASLSKRLRRRHRRVVEKMVEQNPETSRTALMSSHKGTYEWLMKNDIAWFDKALPCKQQWQARPVPGVGRDLTREDAVVARQLHDFVRKITRDFSALRITKKLLLEQISKEHQLLMRKGYLPRTAAFIQENTEVVAQYESRVIGRVRTLIDEGNRIGCQTLATQFLWRNKGRVDLLRKVTALLLDANVSSAMRVPCAEPE